MRVSPRILLAAFVAHAGLLLCRDALELIQTLKLINKYLMRWAMRKYKRLRDHPTRTVRFLAAIANRDRGLFAHWAWGAQPTAG
jgi:hypothetical protein